MKDLNGCAVVPINRRNVGSHLQSTVQKPWSWFQDRSKVTNVLMLAYDLPSSSLTCRYVAPDCLALSMLPYSSLPEGELLTCLPRCALPKVLETRIFKLYVSRLAISDGERGPLTIFDARQGVCTPSDGMRSLKAVTTTEGLLSIDAWRCALQRPCKRYARGPVVI